MSLSTTSNILMTFFQIGNHSGPEKLKKSNQNCKSSVRFSLVVSGKEWPKSSVRLVPGNTKVRSIPNTNIIFFPSDYIRAAEDEDVRKLFFFFLIFVSVRALES